MHLYEKEEEMPSAAPVFPIKWSGPAEIFAPLPPVPWVVKELFLAPGRPAMLAGYGYSGKSIAAQALALAVASGKKAWNRFRVERGLVLHFDHEQGSRGTNRRYQRLAYAMGVDVSDLGDRLRATYFPPLYLSDATAAEHLCEICANAKLAVIDSLRAVTPNVDENDSLIRVHIDKLTYVSEQTGCAFLIVHHAGKGRNGSSDQRETPRGSSAIFDACGLVLQLAQHKSEEAGVTITRLTMSKSPAEAEGGARDDFFLKISDVCAPDTCDTHAGLSCEYRNEEQIAATQSGEEGIDVAVMDFLRKNPGAGKTEIRAYVSGRGVRVDGAVDALERRGLIECRSAGRKHSYFLVSSDDE